MSKTLGDKPPIQIDVESKNRFTLKIKIAYYIKLLTPESMKLLGSIERRITKHKNGDNVPQLEISQVVLVYCNII